MDHENEKYWASPPLKKVIPQLLLSVSIFSLIFSYSSLYSSSFSSSSLVYSPGFKFHYNFSPKYSFPFLSHSAFNKNCLFLICNGLLVFLAKTSGLVRPPAEASTSDLINDILQKSIGDGQQMPIDQKVPPEEISTAPADQPKEEEKSFEGQEVSITIAESEEEGTEEKDEISDQSISSCWPFDDVDDDGGELRGQEVEEERDEQEEEKEELSTQELNQKFEDFIRRMKEEIMISDARQKEVMLN
ncbi:hypothetical protein CDL12_15993 [Handroanthus impetiginosus]|uniref:DUF4408 domain-containing protein n=1 Tax=Handroanthus impetiginosus TaxID=429701 RepID=A0A2G9H1K0_9LAMI|nr:hypothetical protein CDL12_15993 [Handroanthus impetiginosus]